MNVKTVGTSNILSIDAGKKTTGPKDMKSEASSKDRDANARNDGQNEEGKKHLSDEEFQQALEYIKNLQSVTENNWKVEFEFIDTLRVVYIKDLLDKVIRRIPEPELWSLLKEKPEPDKGQLYDKAT